MPGQSRPKPRQLVDHWPDGHVKPSVAPQDLADLLPLLAAVRVMKQRVTDLSINVTGLSAHHGLNRSTVQNILNGDQWPTWVQMLRLARALGVPEALEAAAEALTADS